MRYKGFKAAWLRVPQGEAASVREEVKAALGVTSDVMFHAAKDGKRVIKAAEVAPIEAAFRKHGISNPWDE